MLLNWFLYWLPMIVLAIANGAARQAWLLARFGDLRAHQLSTATLLLACGLYTALIFPKLQVATGKQAWWAGLFWMTLTFVFETGMGLAAGKKLPVIFADYDLLHGRLWPLFLAGLLCLPYLCFRLR